MFRFRVLLIVLVGFLLPPALSATLAYSKRDRLPLLSSAQAGSRPRAYLRQGQKVAVYKKAGNYYLVKAKVGGKVLQGYVIRGSLSRSAVSRSNRPPAKPTPSAPAPIFGADESPSRDFFGDVKPKSRRNLSRSGRSRGSKATKNRSKKASRSEDTKIETSLGLGFSYLTHSVESSSNRFDYFLLGPELQAKASYRFWQSSNSTSQASVSLYYAQAFLNSEATLQDNSGNTFDTRDQKNRSSDVSLRANFTHALPSLRLGFSGGYRVYTFKGDDVVSDSNDPLGLFVEQKTSGLVAGPSFEFELGACQLTTEAQMMFLTSHEESPDQISGGSVSPSLNLFGDVNAAFKLGERSFLNVFYSLRFLKNQFTGDATRVEKSFSDIETTTFSHLLGLAYDYHF